MQMLWFISKPRGGIPVHRLCALVLVLSSCLSAQAQNWSIKEGFYFDDCLGQIIEPSAVSPQGLATEPSVEEPARDISAEVIQPGGEPIADQSDRLESKLTDRATEPNTEPPGRVGAVGTDQERDFSVQAVQPQILNSEISTTGSTAQNASAAELARVIERILDEAMQPGDDCQAIAQPPLNGAEKTPSADNLTDGAGELTAIVEQSRPAQIVTGEPGLSNRTEGEVLNTFYQDLE
jgi:hypothetical protein